MQKLLGKSTATGTTNPLAHILHTNKIGIKKDRPGNLSLTDRGDRIRTCDLVLPKQWVVEAKIIRRIQTETQESVDTGTILQDNIDLYLYMF